MAAVKALTEAQAEVFEELWSQGYGSLGFLPHEMFRERDNRANGMRRTMRNMIRAGLFAEDTRTTDGRGNHYHHFTQQVKDSYSAFQKRKWDQEARELAKSRA
jgi:hypothetical protein